MSSFIKILFLKINHNFVENHFFKFWVIFDNLTNILIEISFLYIVTLLNKVLNPFLFCKTFFKSVLLDLFLRYFDIPLYDL